MRIGLNSGRRHEELRHQLASPAGRHRPADANPNADAQAPFKVDKSADGRFTEPLRDTPKSITVIPKEVIEDQGATSFRELARTTPGVTLGTGEGGNAFGVRIFIRGFEARNDVYIDGQRDPGVSSREIFAVEQVEIVKGPSAAYFGRGTTGGSVGLESKKAQTGNDFAVGELTGGTSDMLRATVDANYQLGKGAALRVNALYHTGDTPGRDHVDNERWGGSAALTWNLSPTLTLDADYYHFRTDGMSDYGHPFDVTTLEPYKVDADNFYGAVGRDFNKNAADIGTAAVGQHEAAQPDALRRSLQPLRRQRAARPARRRQQSGRPRRRLRPRRVGGRHRHPAAQRDHRLSRQYHHAQPRPRHRRDRPRHRARGRAEQREGDQLALRFPGLHRKRQWRAGRYPERLHPRLA